MGEGAEKGGTNGERSQLFKEETLGNTSFFLGGVWGMECYNFVKVEVSCRLNFSHSLVSYLFVLGDFLRFACRFLYGTQIDGITDTTTHVG